MIPKISFNFPAELKVYFKMINAASTLRRIDSLVTQANLLYQGSSTDFFVEITLFIEAALNMLVDISKELLA
jgi:hypothetical protein